MKRFGLVLLSLVLIAAFNTQVMAVDVKFSGEFYVAGMYLDKTTFKKDTASDGPSTAFYFQRLRVKTDFVVSPGLTLQTRFDAMERAWGAARSTPGSDLLMTAQHARSAGTVAENENIAFDEAHLSYTSPIGMFRVGYIIDGEWGTVFGDYTEPLGKVGYYIKYGGLTALFEMAKTSGGERSYTAKNTTTNASDQDGSIYQSGFYYDWKNGQAGFLVKYVRDAGYRNLGISGSDAGFITNAYILVPYAKVKLGYVALQAELLHLFGQLQKWEGSGMGALSDTRMEQYAGWVDVTADFGKFYAGGSVAYVSGDDPGTGQIEGSNLIDVGVTGGYDWNPCLIIFNSDLTYWAGSQAGHGGVNAGPMTNAWFFQVRGGLKPTEKLDIMASISYANADKKPSAAWLYNDYGYEVDLTAKYQITNNLSYILGAGYLFTGKYYKGTSDTGTNLANDYMLISKLTLTF